MMLCEYHFTRTNFLTDFYDKNPKIGTKTKIGMLVNTAPDEEKLKLIRQMQRACEQCYQFF